MGLEIINHPFLQVKQVFFPLGEVGDGGEAMAQVFFG